MKIIKIFLFMLVVLLIVGTVSAYIFRTIYNPFTGKLDYHIIENLTGYNVSADYFIGDGSLLVNVTGTIGSLSANASVLQGWNGSTNVTLRTNKDGILKMAVEVYDDYNTSTFQKVGSALNIIQSFWDNLFYRKTEINTLSKMETIWSKDVIDSTELDNGSIVRSHNTSWKVDNATYADDSSQLGGQNPSYYMPASTDNWVNQTGDNVTWLNVTENIHIEGNITNPINTTWGYYNDGSCIVIGDLKYVSECS